MRASRWVHATIAMTGFIASGYVVACGTHASDSEDQRVDEAQQAIGETCQAVIGGGWQCTLSYYTWQQGSCCGPSSPPICKDIENDNSNCGSCGVSCGLLSGNKWAQISV